MTCCTMTSISGDAFEELSSAGSNSERGIIGPTGINGFGGGGGSRLTNQSSMSFLVMVDLFKPSSEDKMELTRSENCSGDSSDNLSTRERNLKQYKSH